MSSQDREIPQRELRNDIARVLREVAAGTSMRVTVGGKPVAELRPVRSQRRFAPVAEVRRILREAPLDTGFARDVDDALAGTVDEL